MYDGAPAARVRWGGFGEERKTSRRRIGKEGDESREGGYSAVEERAAEQRSRSRRDEEGPVNGTGEKRDRRRDNGGSGAADEHGGGRRHGQGQGNEKEHARHKTSAAGCV